MLECFCNFFPKKRRKFQHLKKCCHFSCNIACGIVAPPPNNICFKTLYIVGTSTLQFQKFHQIITLASIFSYGSLHYLTLNISFINNLAPFLSKFLFQVPCTQHELFDIRIGPNDLVNGQCDSSFPLSKITKSFDYIKTYFDQCMAILWLDCEWHMNG